MDGTGREFSVQHFCLRKEKKQTEHKEYIHKSSRQIDRYTLMKEREM